MPVQTEAQYTTPADGRQLRGRWTACQGPARRLVVVSVDGLASADLPLLSNLNHFGRMIREGCLCPELRGVYPTETYPLHASAMTGTWPDRHGVRANVRLQPGRVAADWHWYRRDLQATPLYEVAQQAGYRVATLLWPSAGRSGVRYCLPEIQPVRPGQSLVRMALGAGSPLFTLAVMLRNLPLLKDLRYAVLDDVTCSSACRLLERGRAELVLLHLVDLDGVRHERGFRGAWVEPTLRDMDRRLGELLEAGGGLQGSTAFVVFGDHAYIDVHTVIAPNALLRQAGLIQVDAPPPAGGRRRRGGGEPRVRDWRAWAVTCGGSAHVYLRRPEDSGLRQRVRALLGELTRGLDGPVERIYEQAEARRERVGHDVDFVLEARPGFCFVPELEEVCREAAQAATHGYHPDRPGYSSLALAAGAGIRRGGQLAAARIVDLGPTLAAVLGLSLPQAEGRVLSGIFAEGASP